MFKRHPLLKVATAGFYSGLVFIAVGLLLRLLGVPTLGELFSDRFAPLLGIPLFFKMLSLFGGYSHLKQLGFCSVLGGEVVAFVGAAFLINRLTKGKIRLIPPITGVLAAAGAVATLVALAPNLATNYRGLTPASAIAANVVAILLTSSLAAWFLAWSLSALAQPGVQGSANNDRRRELMASGAAALAGLAIAAVLFRFFRISAYTYDGTENSGKDLPPVTPNDRFYAVTKNNVDPRPDASVWGLRITGNVTSPRTLRLSDITAMPFVMREVTLQCISNRIGGGLNSNAVWKGVPLKQLLTASGADATSVQVTFHGADGFTDDIPFAKAMDDETLLVYEMNGVALPLHHGYPARLIVPGYVGEKSVKWVTEIEVTKQPHKGFYEQQGWGPKFTLNNTARFDAPDFGHPISLGTVVTLRGTAFAGDRGVARVQVSTDGEETWREAEITYKRSKTAWVQWRLLWKPVDAGDMMLAVRCIDEGGGMQSGEKKGPAPEPTTGYHRVKAMVRA